MSGSTINEKGETLVTTTDVSELERAQRSTEELLELLLREQRKTNIYLAILTGEEVEVNEEIV